MKTITKEEASRVYGILTSSKYSTGLRYYLTDDGNVVDSDGNTRYIAKKNSEYKDFYRITKLDNGFLKRETAKDIFFDSIVDTDYCNNVKAVFSSPFSGIDIIGYNIRGEYFTDKNKALDKVKELLKETDSVCMAIIFRK